VDHPYTASGGVKCDYREPLREPLNVPDAMKRDAIIRRFRHARSNAAQLKADIEDWNRNHPDQKPIDTALEDAIIAYCDGKGPWPATVMIDGKPHALVNGKLREIP
jgi:hypothetical protein